LFVAITAAVVATVQLRVQPEGSARGVKWGRSPFCLHANFVASAVAAVASCCCCNGKQLLKHCCNCYNASNRPFSLIETIKNIVAIGILLQDGHVIKEEFVA